MTTLSSLIAEYLHKLYDDMKDAKKHNDIISINSQKSDYSQIFLDGVCESLQLVKQMNI